MNGLLKEKLMKLGNNSYHGWKDHLLTTLRQLNNRVLSNHQTPLQRMMTPTMEVRQQATTSNELTISWWKFHPAAIGPWNATNSAAGYDLFTYLDTKLPSSAQQVITTGIGMQMPHGYYGQIAARSSLALKGMVILGGIIDSNYYGEIKVLCYNISDSDIVLPKGSRIAQILFLPCLHTSNWALLKEPPDPISHMRFESTNGHVWVQTAPHQPLQAGEIIAKGKDNCVYVMIPPNDTPKLIPTNHLFERP